MLYAVCAIRAVCAVRAVRAVRAVHAVLKEEKKKITQPIKKKKIMQPLQNCIGPTIRIGREILCLPYAGFLKRTFLTCDR